MKGGASRDTTSFFTHRPRRAEILFSDKLTRYMYGSIIIPINGHVDFWLFMTLELSRSMLGAWVDEVHVWQYYNPDYN